eukprot:TRINITY_DN13642_c0_g1_i1.p1 TRINITY_DN13642_c0_g1~~TRINITY_DN13642_c0_g1_i1.p1  ORF type:complete len:298 (-),score=35.82 TRINITY_DN13642_c0_g1_i1:85-978(-)
MAPGGNDLVISALAGGLAGAVETVLTYPLDLAKTRQQLCTSGASTTTPKVIVEVWRNEGSRALFRGLAVPLSSEVPRHALKFGLNSFFVSRLSEFAPPDRGLLGDTALRTVAGAAAGTSETLFHTPFEVVKIRMQAPSVGHGSPVSMLNRGPWSLALGVLRHEGIRGLYAGLEAYALRQAIWNGAFFGLLGFFKGFWPEGGGGTVGSTAGRDFTFGLLSGCAATCLNNPVDVAKSRIQHEGARCWSLPTVVGIAREEGVRGLCKGLPARLYRSAPGHGLLYMGFEFFASVLRERRAC